jgi:hypothetical protein
MIFLFSPCTPDPKVPTCEESCKKDENKGSAVCKTNYPCFNNNKGDDCKAYCVGEKLAKPECSEFKPKEE